jgi:hypothetical protein
MPMLADFLRFESADPVLLATKERNYPELLFKLFKIPTGLSDAESRALRFLSREVLAAKRLHELTLMSLLVDGRGRTDEEIGDAFGAAGIPSDPTHVQSAVRTLSLEFNTEPEVASYGLEPLLQTIPDGSRLASWLIDSYAKNPEFRRHVDDLIQTGLALVGARYDRDRPFTPSRQYSRKDASRLLGWVSNMSATIYGYRVDKATGTCPIFITYHKSDDVSASTAYEDELIDTSTMLWYTRSNRTLHSSEVAAIVSNEVALHVFAKKDDAEGPDFYYLGRATSEDAEQTTMLGADGRALNVVRMRLKFSEPIDSALFDYFHPVVTVG